MLQKRRELCMGCFPFKEMLSITPEIIVTIFPHKLGLFLLESTGGVAFELAMVTE